MENSQNLETTDRAIMEIINGKRNMSFAFMAANVLVKHIQMIYSKEPSEKTLHEGCRQLKKLLAQNSRLPSVNEDIAMINSMER